MEKFCNNKAKLAKVIFEPGEALNCELGEISRYAAYLGLSNAPYLTKSPKM